MITFKNKEEYLTWRAQWRADYKALSAAIRDIKFTRWFEDSARHGVKMSEAQVARHKAIAKTHGEQFGFCPNYALRKLRAKATLMLEERRDSKVAAQSQYQNKIQSHQTSSGVSA